MRMAHFSELVALTLFLNQSAFGQNSILSQLEQGLQGPGGAPTAAVNGYLGAELEDEGQMGKGVLVTRIRPGTPAEKGGLKAGDLITMVDGKPISNLDAYDAVAKRPVGATINMTIVRSGETKQLPVTLGTRPAAPSLTDPNPVDPTPAPTPATSSPPGPAPSLLPATGGASPTPTPADSTPRSSGIVATPQAPAPSTGELPPGPTAAAWGGNASLGVRLPRPETARFRSQRGAFIDAVNPGTPAEQAGLKVGQMIVQVDARPIDTDDDLIAAIRARQPGQSVELTVRDGNQTFKKTVRLAQAGATPPASPSADPLGSAPAPSGTGRPLLDRIDRIADSFSPRHYSTVYDPQAFSALQDRVTALENRLKAIEAKVGITAPASAAPFGSTTPGFNSPTPQTTPGFGSPSP